MAEARLSWSSGLEARVRVDEAIENSGVCMRSNVEVSSEGLGVNIQH